MLLVHLNETLALHPVPVVMWAPAVVWALAVVWAPAVTLVQEVPPAESQSVGVEVAQQVQVHWMAQSFASCCCWPLRQASMRRSPCRLTT